jgi:rhodanese-related sulfurtransferase
VKPDHTTLEFDRIVIAAVALLLCFLTRTATCAPALSIDGSYCGVNSLYAAMRLQGSTVSLDDLAQPKYIGSVQGSTLAQLQQAAQDHAVYAVPMGSLTTDALRVADRPIILHVMGSELRRRYDHWLLFLRPTPDGALVYDAPNAPSVISWRDLEARWDGIGLVVSASPINVSALQLPAIKSLLTWLATGGALVLAVQLCRPQQARGIAGVRHGRFRPALKELAVLAGVAFIGGFLSQTLTAEGLLAGESRAAPATEAFAATWMRQVSLSEVKALVAHRPPRTLIVDARHGPDYVAGHIPGAISIPVESDTPSVARALRDVDPDTRIIVYCQSTSCVFDDLVASEIQRSGYRNVQIFRDGWLGWSNSGQQ